MEDGETETYIQWYCRGRADFWTGESLPSDIQVTYDTLYTIRAWRGIISYLLSDYRFIYE